MNVLAAYLRLYGSCLRRAAKGIAKSPWTLLLPLGLLLAFQAMLPLAGMLGILGGFAMALILDALFSCYLYFTGEVVAESKVSVDELKKSLGAYFFAVMNVLFVFYVANLILGYTVAAGPGARMVDLAVNLLTAVLLNVVPEVLYIRGTRGGLETMSRSVKFIQENWLEWFIPNGLLLAGMYFFLTEIVFRLPFWGYVGAGLVLSAAFHLLMVFRGHLFRELDGSSHRQRMFKYRLANSSQ